MNCANIVSSVSELFVEMLTSHVVDGDTECVRVSSMPVITSITRGECDQFVSVMCHECHKF